jgi:hypothetical protein
MAQNQSKARVFISCGQKCDEEKRLATEVRDMLEDSPFNFDAYVADLEHSQKDVMRAVLESLESSEYFLCIDFKREKLDGTCGANGDFRGSLFTHQELAIATFLDIEQLRFKEKGVEWNGISSLL